jgi:hypothetical protein
MKVGDKIYHKKYAGLATVIQSTVETTWDVRKQKEVVRTKYLATYPDGRPITFFGYDVNKTIFKHKPVNEQMTLFDFIKEN